MTVMRNGNRGDEDFMHGLRKAAFNGLLGQDELDALNARAIGTLTASLDKTSATLETQKSNSSIKLFKWVRHELTLASTTGVYGQHNPFRDPKVEEAWL